MLPPSALEFIFSAGANVDLEVIINIFWLFGPPGNSRVWTSDVIAQNTWLYQVLVKLRFNDAQTVDGQGYLYIQTSGNEAKNKTSV